jgi:hypothetical protein
MHIYDYNLLNSFRLRDVSDKLCKKIKTLCMSCNPFPKIVLCEIKWKNTVQYEKSQMI